MLRRLLVGSACATVLAAVTVAGLTASARADTLKMKDGTSVTGRVMDGGSTYWVKGADGQSKRVAKTDVQEWVKGDAAPAATPPGDPAAASAQSQAGRGQAAKLPASGSFKATQAKADKAETPVQAIALWQSFIDNHPPAGELSAAKEQLAYWNKLLAGDAEKVNGKWVYGEERKKLLKQVHTLVLQAVKDINGSQTLTGIRELEQACKLYPNSFEANFELGYFNLSQGAMGNNNAKLDAGVRAMEQAVHLRPSSAPALANLAISYHFRKRYVTSVETAYQAAKLNDSKEIVEVLINCIARAPGGMVRNNTKIKPMVEEALTLAQKYGLNGGGEGWRWLPMEDEEESKGRHKDDGSESEDKGPPGIRGNGSGELVSADGYILTNRHVAKEGDYLMVRLADGTLKVADRVVIDDEQDMAVIKIKTDDALPYVKLAPYDSPPVGSDLAVFGFPLLGMISGLDSSVKMTRGGVVAVDKNREGCDVTIDANINPGNSGGPVVDKYGNLLGIATAKSFAGNIEGEASISSYGLAQGTGRIRKFLAKNAAKLTALHIETGTSAKLLSNEELATKMTPVTVVVLICRGTAPTPDAAGNAKAPERPGAADAAPKGGKSPARPKAGKVED